MKSPSESLALSILVVSLALAGCSKKQSHVYSALKDRAVAAQLKQFVAEKRSQAYAAGDKPSPELDAFFAAAERGDWLAVSNHFGPLLKRARGEQLSGPRLSTLF